MSSRTIAAVQKLRNVKEKKNVGFVPCLDPREIHPMAVPMASIESLFESCIAMGEDRYVYNVGEEKIQAAFYLGNATE
jgi:hypothetical protein